MNSVINKNDIVISNVAFGSVVIEPGSTFEDALRQYDSKATPAQLLAKSDFYKGDRKLGVADLAFVLNPGTEITVYSKDAFDTIEGNCEGCGDISACEDATAEQKEAAQWLGLTARPLVEGHAPVATEGETTQAQADEAVRVSIIQSVVNGSTDYATDPLGIGADAFSGGDHGRYDLSKLSDEQRRIVSIWDENNDGFLDATEVLDKVTQLGELPGITGVGGIVSGQHTSEFDDQSEDDEDDDESDEQSEEDAEEMAELAEILGEAPSSGDVVDPEAPVVEGQHTATLEAPTKRSVHPRHEEAYDPETDTLDISKLSPADQALANPMDANHDGFLSFEEYMNSMISSVEQPAEDSDQN